MHIPASMPVVRAKSECIRPSTFIVSFIEGRMPARHLPLRQ
jgi:hypothetical protein